MYLTGAINQLDHTRIQAIEREWMTVSVVMTIISNSDYPIIIMWGSYTEQQEYKWDYST